MTRGIATCAVIETPIGRLRIGVDERGTVREARWTEDDAEPVVHPLLRPVVTELEEYFAGRRRRFDVHAEPTIGTPFERRVWQALCAIPFGATVSYGAIAAALGQPRAARAVGRANGSNPIALFVPCHRVIGASGALTGYAGGLEVKRRLLAHEAASS